MAKGYTKIDNELFDTALSADISPAEFKVLMFLIRYSIGFHRDTIKASYSYISKGTGLSAPTVKRAIKKFISDGVIELLYQNSGSSAQVFKFLYKKMITSYGQNLYPYGVKNDHKNGVKNDHQEIIEEIKDKEIKEKKEAPLPFSSFFEGMNPDDMTDEQYELWQEWRVKYGII